MNRSLAKLACAAAVAACAALGFPTAAPAFQNITLENGGTTLHIVGDAGKVSDLVTIAYDPVRDEYVIGHDILSAPPGCKFEGGGPPYKVLRCPAKGIEFILVEVALGNDRTVLEGMAAEATAAAGLLDASGVWLPPDLLNVKVLAGPGNDKYEDTNVQPPTLAPVGAHLAVREIDMGGGNDAATVGPGSNTIVFGDGNGKLTTGAGDNIAAFGKGNSKIELGTGTNTVTVGDGNSIVTGGAGPDVVTFGAGVNRFFGGPGADKARMGAGNDVAFGGSGKDKLFGGPGKDRLFGGADFDFLNGGAGTWDKCFGGAGGAMPIGCEVGYRYGR